MDFVICVCFVVLAAEFKVCKLSNKKIELNYNYYYYSDTTISTKLVLIHVV